MAEATRTCIVSPDVVGPINNGGIGTHVYWLARHLASLDHQVTVLFVGPCENGSISHWKRWYRRFGITLRSVEELPCSFKQGFEFLNSSYRVYEYLRGERFDSIHFQDWQACGFHSIQAKAVGLHFADTHLIVTMHSSTQWINSGMLQWNSDPLRETAMMWAERYCCEHTDLLISPSQYMFDWALEQGWNLSPTRKILPYLYSQQPQARGDGDGCIDLSHLVFFGRLETRKGLSLFLDAICPILNEHPGRIRTISFLGKDGVVDGDESASQAIHGALKASNVSYEIQTDLDTFESLRYIKQTGGVAVVPSLVDNYPYTVIECVENGVPLIAAGTGGIPEMVDARCLFDPTPASLRAKLLELSDVFSSPLRHRYNAADAPARWRAVVADSPATGATPAVTGMGGSDAPRVSLCVPYFNYGKYLPELVESINRIRYPNLEVIVVNDGSTDPESIRVFQDIQRQCKDERWTFLSQDNGGVGKARNTAASEATGEYLVFMDSDNVATPHMVQTFVDAIRHRRADCLTCYFRAFEASEHVAEDTQSTFDFCPLGSCLELGPFENVFGDANFIIRKCVFDAIGGFTLDRDTSWEDYEFLARLNLQGYVQDVIPEPLFWYRNTPEGLSRITNRYKNTQRVLRAYAECLPPFLRFFMNGIAVPMVSRPDTVRKYQHVNPRLLKMARETQRILQQVGLMRRDKLRSA